MVSVGWRDGGIEGWLRSGAQLDLNDFSLPFLIWWPDGIKHVIRTQAAKREQDYSGKTAVVIKENYSHQS